jgi:hypothetical protein
MAAVLGRLEEQVVAQFSRDYGDIIERARAKLAPRAPYRNLREFDPLDDDA